MSPSRRRQGLFAISVAAALAVGLAVRPAVDGLADLLSDRANVRCVAGGLVCVGAPIASVFEEIESPPLGGLLYVSCGFTEPGEGADEPRSPVDLMTKSCASQKFVLNFVNGRRRTVVWVDRGRIVRLDSHPEHGIAFP